MDRVQIIKTAKLRIEDLRVSDLNCRLEPDPQNLEYLIESIRTIGLQHPLIVRENSEEPGVYEVVEGSRRLHALKRLGYTTAECRIAIMDDAHALVASLHENIVRGDITASELARGINKMMEMMPPNWSEKKKRREVANQLGWWVTTTKGRKNPDLTRVKDALLMGDFQNKLPGIVIKQRTRGDSTKPTLAWSTARKVREMVSKQATQSFLDEKTPEERSAFIKDLVNVFKELPSQLRTSFEEKFTETPNISPKDIAEQIKEKARVKSHLVAFKADPNLLDAIDEVASKLGKKRSEVIEGLLRDALKQYSLFPLEPSNCLKEENNETE